MKDRISGVTRQRRKTASGKTYDTARCYITRDGVRQCVYLGPWGSPEAEQRYKTLCAEFYSGAIAPMTTTPKHATIAVLFARYLQEREKELGRQELERVKLVMRITLELMPDTPVSEFGAVAFRRVRERLVEYGKAPRRWIATKTGGYWRTLPPCSREYINRLMKRLREVFRWGVGWDLVPPDVLARIDAVRGLTQSDAPEWLEDPEPVEDVPDWAVVATLPYMPPIIADMVKIQRAACLRPSELCRLRVSDVMDIGGIAPVDYRKHKTARCGVLRHIAFSAHELEILRRRIDGKGADEFVFSPRDAVAEHWAALRQKRKTKVQPSQVRRAEAAAAGKLDRYRTYYDSESYSHAVKRAVRRAIAAGEKIPDWFPYQLRHTAVTENSILYGRETAALVAGHMSVKTTEIYDHKAATVAAEVAKKRGEKKAWWE